MFPQNARYNSNKQLKWVFQLYAGEHQTNWDSCSLICVQILYSHYFRQEIVTIATDSSLCRRIINHIYKDEFLHNHTQPSQRYYSVFWLQFIITQTPNVQLFSRDQQEASISQKQVENSFLLFNHVFTLWTINIHNQK